MRSSQIRESPQINANCPHKRGEREEHREEGKAGQRLEGCGHKPSSRSHASWEGPSPRASGGRAVGLSEQAGE